MDINQLIINWHKKALQNDSFSGFVFEYLAFIAFLKRKKYLYPANDRTVIQALKQDSLIKGSYLQKIIDIPDLSETWKNIINELNKTPLGNVSQNGDSVEEIKWWNNSSSDFNNKIKNIDRATGIIYGLDDWENMIEFWYSIRNNLFHGGKDPQNGRDQFLAENGRKTLRSLVDIFLSNE